MKLLKRISNRLLRPMGYQIVKNPKNATAHSGKETANRKYAVVDFTLENIFDAVPDWISKFEINGKTYGGTHDYTTQRISMLNREQVHEFVELAGKTVIEFGPLEAGNTIILEKLGAKRVTAIEGRRENYLKCCIIKNMFGLNKSTFYFDDAMNATVEKYGRHDVAFVAGLLYHLDKPHTFIEHVSEIADTIILSTHFADADSPAPDARVETLEGNGKTYQGKLFGEGKWTEAGLQRWSFWPYREDLLSMIRDAGYKNVSVVHESTDQGTNYKLIHVVAKK